MYLPANTPLKRAILSFVKSLLNPIFPNSDMDYTQNSPHRPVLYFMLFIQDTLKYSLK